MHSFKFNDVYHMHAVFLCLSQDCRNARVDLLYGGWRICVLDSLSRNNVCVHTFTRILTHGYSNIFSTQGHAIVACRQMQSP